MTQEQFKALDASWPSYLAKFLANDLAGLCRKHGTTIPTCGIDPALLGPLVKLVQMGVFERKDVRRMIADRLQLLKG